MHPSVQFLPKRHARVARGHPWAYSNEIDMSVEAKAVAPGTVVTLRTAGGEAMGTAFFNPRSLVAARLLSPRADLVIDADWLAARLAEALRVRERLYPAPFYRLVHAEGDRLPGLVIDRFGDLAVVQANAAGMDRLLPDILDALDRVLAPRAVVLRNDSPVRTLEGLGTEVRVAKGEADGPVPVEEGGLVFFADPAGGQKTGWFYDQRENRAFVASLARGARVLDLYTHTGGFALAALAAGAESATLVDSAAPALALAEQAAARNGLADRCKFVRGQAFAEAERLAGEGERFGVVVADPPPFVRAKKDLEPGARAYRKLARLAARLAEPGGVLFLASCSHNMETERFSDAIRGGLADAGRTGRILRRSGAAADHPEHPHLPESGYLKAETLVLD